MPVLQEEVYLGFCSSEGGPWSTMWNGSPRAQSPPGGPSFGFSTPTCTRHLVGMMAGLSWANVLKEGSFFFFALHIKTLDFLLLSGELKEQFSKGTKH